MTRIKLFALLVLMLGFPGLQAQEFGPGAQSDPKIEQAKGMVNTLAYYFNLIGGQRTSLAEKETIINSSYLKLFANEKVQIEDDLQEDRSTVIYKDVQAYLKDIDFFFEDALFEFEIDTVQRLLKADSTPYYRVELIRNLSAVSLLGDSVNTTRKRYIELNLDTKGQELKIASIYTTKMSKEKQLREWWAGLTLAWKKVFQKKLGVFYDSLSNDELFSLVTMDSLDISGNDLILDIEPIYQLTALKHLKISNTWVNDLRPLLSINKLQSLDVSNTSVFDLQYLKYHKDIRKLNLSNCHVEDFGVLKQFEKLSELNLNGIAGANLTFLGDLKNLEVVRLQDAKGLNGFDFGRLAKVKALYLKNSDLTGLNGFERLTLLEELDISGTEVQSLDALGQLRQLKTIRLDNTEINDITPLMGLPQLKRVYANGTSMTNEMVAEFTAKSKALLITNADQLLAWWQNMPVGLKARLQPLLDTMFPSVEELSALTRIDSLNAEDAGLQNLDFLERFQSLQYLNLSGNRINQLDGARLSSRLVEIQMNNTDLNALVNLSRLPQLEVFEARNTALKDLKPFVETPKIRLIDVDGAQAGTREVAELLARRPQVNIRFKTKELVNWWSSMPQSVKKSLRDQASLDDKPNPDELHALIAREQLVFQNIALTESFQASLDHFYRLKSLTLQQSRVSQVADLPQLPALQELALLQMPIKDLTGLSAKYPQLKRLNITNTAVEDLRPLESLVSLEYINFSGTPVKRFRGLEKLTNLKEIDCSNTKVFKLDKLTALKKLEKITCFNTGLRQNDIDKLLESLPNVEVVFY
ncbi:leucine-rich repeat domain-containing protein [Roseivirga thermotolerans]|uniref:leucine-rich repeat domain-containing protein n=1 Tax=Roseivirga thermotolerans TaxID=1758176 RepID=UPI00273DCD99|nr:hypothetical protein [Roseivirga thermotolerans]